MDRFVAFLDVGYLDAASASTLKRDKRKITAPPTGWVEWLKAAGRDLSGTPTFLRAYWYDGAFDPRHPGSRAQRRYFVAGDRDLAEPIRLAQEEGCRMIGAVPEGGSAAWEPRQIVDEVRLISRTELESLFAISGSTAEPARSSVSVRPPA